MVGDGTTTNVLFIGEVMRQAERYIGEGVHPRIIVDGMEVAKIECLKFLEEFKKDIEHGKGVLTLKNGKQIKGIWNDGKL